MKVIATIPAYNEEKTVTQVVNEVKNYVDEVIVVDDGSVDKTGKLARHAGALVYSHFLNRGYGAALGTGTLCALRHGADIIVHFDADGQFEACEIKDIILPLLEGRADIALGTRFKKSKIPLFKRIWLFGAVLFTRFTSGLKLSDTHNGFRAFTREAAQKIRVSQDRMAYSSVILNEIGKHKLKYVEVPVALKYLPHHLKKTQKLPDYFKILFDLFLGKVIK